MEERQVFCGLQSRSRQEAVAAGGKSEEVRGWPVVQIIELLAGCLQPHTLWSFSFKAVV